MSMTEQTDTQRARALIQELRELTGARAIVFWTAKDIVRDWPSFWPDRAKAMTLAEADSWLAHHEQEIQEAMSREGWEYMAEFLPLDGSQTEGEQA